MGGEASDEGGILKSREVLSLHEIAERAGMSPTTVGHYKKTELHETATKGGSRFTGALGPHVVRHGARVYFKPSAAAVLRTLRDAGIRRRGKG